MATKTKKKNKYRKSKQRDRILELLKNTDTHPTAIWIYDQLTDEFPNLSLGTVYRNLKILKDMNLIQELEFGNTYNHYDGKQILHYHFICKNCHSIHNVVIPELHNLNNNIENTYKFNISKHRLEFFGTCHECSTNSK